MRVEEAKLLTCCQDTNFFCKADDCMGWLGSRPDSTDGQCIWLCTCFTLMKAMAPKGGSPIITPK